MRKKALAPGSWTRGSWQWSYAGCEPHASIGYEANLIDPEAAWLRLIFPSITASEKNAGGNSTWRKPEDIHTPWAVRSSSAGGIYAGRLANGYTLMGATGLSEPVIEL